MALKYREEVVGKRFLALKSTNFAEAGPATSNNTRNLLEKKTDTQLKDSEWLAGTIRAASDRNSKTNDFQVVCST